MVGTGACSNRNAGTRPGGVLGAYNAPLQAYDIAVQQNGAGVRGVPKILFSFPQERGNKGVERDSAGGQSPPVWIFAPRLHEDKLRGNDRRGVRLRRTEGLGVSPNSINPTPKNGGQGVEKETKCSNQSAAKSASLN